MHENPQLVNDILKLLLKINEERKEISCQEITQRNFNVKEQRKRKEKRKTNTNTLLIF